MQNPELYGIGNPANAGLLKRADVWVFLDWVHRMNETFIQMLPAQYFQGNKMESQIR